MHRLVAAVAAVVLGVALPPEGYALVGVLALEVGRRAVGHAAPVVAAQDVVLGADALVEGGVLVQLQARVLLSAGYDVHVLPVQVRDRDVVLASVRPEELHRLVRDSQSVGPAQTGVDDDPRLGTVHSRFTDVGVRAPVRPVHVAPQRVQGYSPGFF
jgi:hypothetical protein